jgi:hypothetical protein
MNTLEITVVDKDLDKVCSYVIKSTSRNIMDNFARLSAEEKSIIPEGQSVTYELGFRDITVLKEYLFQKFNWMVPNRGHLIYAYIQMALYVNDVKILEYPSKYLSVIESGVPSNQELSDVINRFINVLKDVH